MAKFANFIGGSYKARVVQADSERSLNFMTESVQSPTGKTKTSTTLISRPGKKTFARLSGMTSVRAECQLNGRGFAVAQSGASNFFYELKADGSYTSYGEIAGDRRPQLDPTQTQILILSGGLGYCFDMRANTLVRITAPAFPIGAIKAGFLDGYSIVLEPKSQLFAISHLNDLTLWDFLDFGDVEGEPGNVVTFVVDHRQIWFLCNTHSEIYYNRGDANFPIVRLEGAFMENGCDALDSAIKIDNTIMWLGHDDLGSGVVWRANGYTPTRVSDYGVEAALDSYGDLSGASAYGYQEAGHTFYVLNVQGHTWVLDIGEGNWHERCFWHSVMGEMQDLAGCHMFVFGKHLVGDWRSGTIYEQSMKYTSDAGAALRRLRAAPDLANGGKFTQYSEFRLLADVGVGL
jgi:hypothetical protein